MRKQKFLRSFSCNFLIDFDEIWQAATTYWPVIFKHVAGFLNVTLIYVTVVFVIFAVVVKVSVLNFHAMSITPLAFVMPKTVLPLVFIAPDTAWHQLTNFHTLATIF